MSDEDFALAIQLSLDAVDNRVSDAATAFCESSGYEIVPTLGAGDCLFCAAAGDFHGTGMLRVVNIGSLRRRVMEQARQEKCEEAELRRIVTPQVHVDADVLKYLVKLPEFAHMTFIVHQFGLVRGVVNHSVIEHGTGATIRRLIMFHNHFSRLERSHMPPAVVFPTAPTFNPWVRKEQQDEEAECNSLIEMMYGSVAISGPQPPTWDDWKAIQLALNE